MPELPEVETVRRGLEAAMLGRRITGVRLLRRDVLVVPGDPPGGFSRSAGNTKPAAYTKSMLLDGARIGALHRLGKQLAIEADDGRTLLVHLGMSGRVRVVRSGSRLEPHTHAVWAVEGGVSCRFVDPRRFGGLWAFGLMEGLRAARWDALGPDALDIRVDGLGRALAGSGRAIKAALLDQGVLAGVGNIYADEALFRSGILPTTPAGSLDRDRVRALARSIRGVLAESIEAKGSTIRDYTDARGEAGGFQNRWRVYGRGGEACVVCGRTLERGTVAQRTTVWCPGCQAG